MLSLSDLNFPAAASENLFCLPDGFATIKAFSGWF
jgi:hypothetical protein